MSEYCRGGCGEELNYIAVRTDDKLCQTCTDAVKRWGVLHRNLPDPFDEPDPLSGSKKARAAFWGALGIGHLSGSERFNHPAWLVLVDEWLAAGAPKIERVTR